MKEIVVLAEHRRGEMRDVTWEMLAKGRELAKTLGVEINAVVLGKGVGHFAETLWSRANKEFLIDDERLEVFNSDPYQAVLSQFLTERKPFLFLFGHSSMGMDLAPALAVSLKTPLATDCVEMVAVIGSPDPVRTEIVKAFIVLKEVSLQESIQNFVKTRLAAHEYSREIEFVKKWPLTATGKIMRKELRKIEVERKEKS